ncbi:ATP-binding protein [Streptomyces gobiensis]|uniref:ATP-binding protein n=1 Tax=Streptomyces gobiensis TaxID=2875706 RepID=UPI001E5AAB18|nr:ATP-binding protein [Streptomyces gobiensis]UGY91484.1 ATP-binding protein [Streptomyces gobiensis]
MTQHIPEAVFWALAVGLLTAMVLLLRQRGITATVRKRNAELADGLRARDEEVRHLAAVRLPALEDSPYQPVPETGLLDERLDGTDFAKSLEHVMDRFSHAVEYAQARADQSAKTALKASMRSVQALVNEQQLFISEMQDRHDNPEVLGDLLEIDHANAQFGRRAQAIAVLCGSWPGRQRVASSLTDVVRGATSRIRDYRRIRLNGQIDIAIESRAVEPVVLTVAELLDNAARHSQPNTMVEVNVQPVHNGACIVIDDAGVGMDGQAADHATALLSGQQAVEVTRLDDPPQFGFAVIGVLAARYGFSVSADTRSPYGGVRAVVFLPTTLLTHIGADKPEISSAAVGRRSSVPAAVRRPSVPDTAADQPLSQAQALLAAQTQTHARPREQEQTRTETTTAGGLPKRRRRSPRPAVSEAPSSTGSSGSTGPTGPTGSHEPNGSEQSEQSGVPDTGGRSAQETAQRMGAFARGTRSGRAAKDDEGKGRG